MSDLPEILPGLHLKEAMEQVGVQPEVFLPIVKRFAEVTIDVVDRLLLANEGGDLGVMRKMSHTLKGASGAIGAEISF